MKHKRIATGIDTYGSKDRSSSFASKYEAFIEGAWHAIVRYDSAHGQPHQDILHPDGSQTKQMFSYYTNAEVLTIGQRDIMEHWPDYRAAYEREVAK